MSDDVKAAATTAADRVIELSETIQFVEESIKAELNALRIVLDAAACNAAPALDSQALERVRQILLATLVDDGDDTDFVIPSLEARELLNLLTRDG